ncbi:hypothetical protein [Dyadobacter pollutisoli]|uniref:Uncharacterized protein n=1 Tax=Dyadobacter pollutisoli TaxID=2910158 RepID=A0A9E8NCF6_9BACT|nr:hypothetical protein [Dyadobacter pollutisoli]WAC11981.1 hypothetical protein ON006_30160 [Dyadobacter pollutisoli]
MEIFRNISKKQSIVHWLFMAILSSGIFLSQEVSYDDRKADAAPIAEKHADHASRDRSVYNFCALPARNVQFKAHTRNVQFACISAISKRHDDLVVQNTLSFSVKLVTIRTGMIQHLLYRTFTTEEPLIFHS